MKLSSALTVLTLSLTACAPSSLTKSQLIEFVRPSVLKMAVGQGHGSGVYLRFADQDFALTNAHVCNIMEKGLAAEQPPVNAFESLFAEDKTPHIDDYKGQGYTKFVVRFKDPNKDLCLVEFKANEELIPLQIADTQVIPEEVMALGYPAGDPMVPSFGFTAQYQRDSLNTQDVSVFTSVKIYGGNSGSPVVNMKGELVGLAAEADNQTSNGIIVSLDNIKSFLAQALK